MVIFIIKKILFIGGDRRNYILYNILKNDFTSYLSGFEKIDCVDNIKSSEIEDTLKTYDIIFGPIPFTNDNKHLNMPFADNPLSTRAILDNVTPSQLLIAGRIPQDVANELDKNLIKHFDLLEREEMAVLNAIPTAEGAIMIAMEEMPITLNLAKVLILGYGRIGKILAKFLKGLGADVFICSRRYTDNAYCKAFGYKHFYLSNLSDLLGEMDVIFNTIPKVVICDEHLKKIKNEDALIIDLASKPGGVDHEKAKSMNIKTIWALSLPGKVAPKTSALYLKEAVLNILKEMGDIKNGSG